MLQLHLKQPGLVVVLQLHLQELQLHGQELGQALHRQELGLVVVVQLHLQELEPQQQASFCLSHVEPESLSPDLLADFVQATQP